MSGAAGNETRRRSFAPAQAIDLAVAGALGGVFGLFLYVELVDARSVYVRDALAGVAIGGTVGFFLAAWGPFREGAWLKLAHVSTRGALAGAVGGALGLVLGEWVIGALKGGLTGRALSWSVLGLGIGISQGFASCSRLKLVYGLIGGALGGGAGGYLFEALRVAFGNRYDLGQGVGIAALGAGLGAALALVEQALRRSWVQVLNGRQEGRSYLLSGPVASLGLDERAAVGLFGDASVARRHAEIVATREGFRLRNHLESDRTRLNGQAVDVEAPLRDGDLIELGRTRLLFRQR